MLDRLFGGDAFIATSRALDASALRHQIIANNLANINTPGYKRQDVTFESQLSRALDERKEGGKTGENPVDSVQPAVITQNTTSMRQDGNNVDMEAENVNAAINTLRFEALSQMVGGYFGGLKSVISGR
jgi:flagellar basal-body rod protein FlgB